MYFRQTNFGHQHYKREQKCKNSKIELNFEIKYLSHTESTETCNMAMERKFCQLPGKLKIKCYKFSPEIDFRALCVRWYSIIGSNFRLGCQKSTVPTNQIVIRLIRLSSSISLGEERQLHIHISGHP